MPGLFIQEIYTVFPHAYIVFIIENDFIVFPTKNKREKKQQQ